jgi:ABC-type spermidine/putrescine transport system permease subunit I
MSNISSFTTPYLIGASQRKMLGVYLREQFGRGKYEIAAATSVIIFILCSISAIVYLYTNMKEQAWEEN